MPFSDAIPLNRVADAANSRFDLRSDGSGARRGKVSPKQAPRQSVNISQDTLLRLARSKLAKTVRHKLAYGRDGTFGREEPVGQFLAAKA